MISDRFTEPLPINEKSRVEDSVQSENLQMKAALEASEKRIAELTHIARENHALREECRNLREERDQLQVTLESVTNKLRAQQGEIDYLNRQIDVMRTEVAEFLDDISNSENLKSENVKLKKEFEALRAENERVQQESQRGTECMEQLKSKNTELVKSVSELEDGKVKLQKEVQALNSQLSEKLGEVEALDRKNKDFASKNEELVKILEQEREELQQKEENIFDLHHEIEELRSEFERASLLLERERNESHKKERNLNDLIQQVSQLIQKNDNLNEQLLKEKEHAIKLEETSAENQKKNSQLSEQIDALTTQLEEEKQRRKEHERLVSDLRRELEITKKNFESHSWRAYIDRANLSNEMRVQWERLFEDASDSGDRIEAINALKGEFAALMEQNQKLSECVDELKGGVAKAATSENFKKKLRELNLLIPEKLFELNQSTEQIEFLAREFDRSEQEKRRLAASLEAQKDDSAAKEFVISSLKNQNTSLLIAQEMLNKIREEVFAFEGEKKDVLKRIESLKAYLSRNSKVDRVLNQRFNSAEQELIKKKDEQLFELHKRIRKLLGELRWKGYDLHNEEAQDTKSGALDGLNPSQLSQMMEMLTNLMTSKDDQTSAVETKLEEENEKLKEKLQGLSKKITRVYIKVKELICGNKSTKKTLRKWLGTCNEEMSVEAEILKTGAGIIDHAKLYEFLMKISTRVSNVEKNLSSLNEKDEQVLKELNALAKETAGESHSDSDPEEDASERKTKRMKQKSKTAAQEESSNEDDSVEETLCKSSKTERTSSSSFVVKETVRRSEFSEANSFTSGLMMPHSYLQVHPQNSQNIGFTLQSPRGQQVYQGGTLSSGHFQTGFLQQNQQQPPLSRNGSSGVLSPQDLSLVSNSQRALQKPCENKQGYFMSFGGGLTSEQKCPTPLSELKSNYLPNTPRQENEGFPRPRSNSNIYQGWELNGKSPRMGVNRGSGNQSLRQSTKDEYFSTIPRFSANQDYFKDRRYSTNATPSYDGRDGSRTPVGDYKLSQRNNSENKENMSSGNVVGESRHENQGIKLEKGEGINEIYLI